MQLQRQVLSIISGMRLYQDSSSYGLTQTWWIFLTPGGQPDAINMSLNDSMFNTRSARAIITIKLMVEAHRICHESSAFPYRQPTWADQTICALIELGEIYIRPI